MSAKAISTRSLIAIVSGVLPAVTVAPSPMDNQVFARFVLIVGEYSWFLGDTRAECSAIRSRRSPSFMFHQEHLLTALECLAVTCIADIVRIGGPTKVCVILKQPLRQGQPLRKRSSRTLSHKAPTSWSVPTTSR